MPWLEWAFYFHTDVIGMITARGFKLYTDLLKVQGSYFLIQILSGGPKAREALLCNQPIKSGIAFILRYDRNPLCIICNTHRDHRTFSALASLEKGPIIKSATITKAVPVTIDCQQRNQHYVRNQSRLIRTGLGDTKGGLVYNISRLPPTK